MTGEPRSSTRKVSSTPRSGPTLRIFAARAGGAAPTGAADQEAGQGRRPGVGGIWSVVNNGQATTTSTTARNSRSSQGRGGSSGAW